MHKGRGVTYALGLFALSKVLEIFQSFSKRFGLIKETAKSNSDRIGCSTTSTANTIIKNKIMLSSQIPSKYFSPITQWSKEVTVLQEKR